MSDMPVLEHPSSVSSKAIHRCMELRPIMDRLGLSPIIVGIGRVIVGSAPETGAVVAVEGVASQHAEIHFDGRQARVKVLSPLTWLNDGPVRDAPLRQGDNLTIGPVEYRVAFVDVPAPPPAPPPVPNIKPSPPQSTIAAVSPASSRTQRRETALPTSESTNRPGRSSRPAIDIRTSTSIEPLLDEALAAQNLRNDLARLEREAAWHRSHPPIPVIAHAPDIDSSIATGSYFDRWDIGDEERTPSVRQAPATATRRNEDLERKQADLQAELTWLEAERASLGEQTAQLEEERRQDRVERQQATELLQQEMAAFQREQEHFAKRRRQLDADQLELLQREQQLAEQQSEFDAAVAALDSDRDHVRRDREALQHDIDQARSRQAAVKAELAGRDAELQIQSKRLHEQLAEIEARELAAEEQSRAVASKYRRQEQDFSRREAALALRESSLRSRSAELDARTERLEHTTQQLHTQQSGLDAAQENLLRSQRDLERLQQELASNRDRVRTQSNALSDQARKTDAEWGQLQTLQAELQQERTAHEDREASLARREATLESREHEVAASRLECEQLQAELKAQAAELDTRVSSQDQRQSDVDERRTADAEQLESDRAQVNAERERLESWEAELQSRQSELALSAAQLDSQANVPADSADLAAEAEQIREQQIELEKAVTELERERESLQRQQSDLSDRESELTRWEARLDERETNHIEGDAAGDVAAEIAQLKSLVETLTSERDQLRSEYPGEDVINRSDELESELKSLTADRDRLLLELNDRNDQSSTEELQSLVDALTIERDRLRAELEVAKSARASIESERVALPQTISAETDTQPQEHQETSFDRESIAGTEDPGAESSQQKEFDGSSIAELFARVQGDSLEAADHESELIDDDDQPPRADELEYQDDPSTDAGHTLSSASDEPVSKAPTASQRSAQPESGIRSQLAMLFGIDAKQLVETEARHRDDLPPDPEGHAEESAVEFERRMASEQRPNKQRANEGDAVLPEESQETQPPLPSGDDSVAAYMQRLLSGNSTASDPIPRGTQESSKAPTQFADEALQSDDDEAARSEDKYAGEIVDSDGESNQTPQSSRRRDKVEIAELRANIDSMRQIANLSARSAVARHYASKLEVTKKVKLTLTSVAAGLSTLLLTAEFWTDSSYRMPGFCSLAVTLIAAIELARTMIQMRRVRQIAGITPGTDSEAATDSEEDSAGSDA